MKKILAFLGLLTFTLNCISQENGIFKDNRKEALIFLSQTKTIRNKDYPESLKEKIIEFKSTLNKDSAEQILRTSLTLEDKSSSCFVGTAYINNGLGMNQKISGTTSSVMTSGNLTTETTTTYRSVAPILIPYSDIENVYIRKFKNTFTIEFYTKIYKSVPLSKRPYSGNNFFWFEVKPEADEVALIASLLFLCNNIKTK